MSLNLCERVRGELVLKFYTLLDENLVRLSKWVEERLPEIRETTSLRRFLFKGNHARCGYDELLRIEAVDWKVGIVRIHDLRTGETRDWTISELKEDMRAMENQDEGYWFESEVGRKRFWKEDQS